MFETLKIWFVMMKSKKGFYIPALAFLAIVIIIFIIIMTYNPDVKKTTIDVATAIRGSPSLNKTQP